MENIVNQKERKKKIRRVFKTNLNSYEESNQPQYLRTVKSIHE